MQLSTALPRELARRRFRWSIKKRTVVGPLQEIELFWLEDVEGWNPWL